MRIHSNLNVGAWFILMAAGAVGGPTVFAKETSKDAIDKADLRLADPIQHGAMTVYPVVSNQPRQADPYITLAEGLAAGTIKVTEMGSGSGNGQALAQTTATDNVEPANDSPAQQIDISDLFGGPPNENVQRTNGNQVNLVRVENKGDKPLYLMPGEIILGGDQDRAIAEEYVIQPDGKPIGVKVFCVEHGRWGNRDQQYNVDALQAFAMNIQNPSSRSQISAQAAKADKDEFIASANVGNKSVRLAVQQAAKQSTVWDEVAKLNRKSGAKTGSGTYTANFTGKNVNQKLQPYRDAFRDPVAKVTNIVGVVVEINGQPEAADLFATTPLFKKLWPRLLEGYAVDAATAGANDRELKETGKTESNTARKDANAAREFLANVLSGQSTAAGGGAHGRSKQVFASASEQSFMADAVSASVPVHIAGFSSNGEATEAIAEQVAIPAVQESP